VLHSLLSVDFLEPIAECYNPRV